jgi:hypothetical protein
MSDIDVEVVPDTGENTDTNHHYYVDLVELPELRRYICLDMARMMAVLPEKTVKIAREMETFLKGAGPRAVE